MKILNIAQHELAEVLLLNESAVPHVSSIDEVEMQWFADHAAFFDVARIDGDLAGFLIGLRPGTSYKSVNYRWFCEHYNDFAYVDRVVVAAQARRLGVAETLYKKFAESQSGVPRMTCEVNVRPTNPVSMRFHEQQGFRQVGTQESEGGTKTVAMMEKTL